MRCQRTFWRLWLLLALLCPALAFASFTHPSPQQAALSLSRPQSISIPSPAFVDVDVCYVCVNGRLVPIAVSFVEYDPLNRMQEDVNAGLLPALTPVVRRMTQDPADRMTTIQEKPYPDSPAWTNNTPTWDANGNMLTDGYGLTLGSDVDNRVTNLQSAVLGSRTFFYTGRGGVIKRTVSGTHLVDVLDGTRLLMTRTTNGAAVVYYLWGNGLIAQVGTNGAALYCHADGQGNVLAMTGAGGQVTDQWFHSPYGTVLNRTGSTDTPFQWLGGHGVRCEGGGIYLTHYRVYHAGLMRFTSVDPIGIAGGANLYAYCSGDPLLLTDVSGLCPDYLLGSQFRQGIYVYSSAARAAECYANGDSVLGTVNLLNAGMEAFAPVAAIRFVTALPSMISTAFAADTIAPVANAAKTTVSTGRTIAMGLKEQLAMEQVMAKPMGTTPPRLPVMSDTKNGLMAADGWVKRVQNVNGVEIHYVENLKTKQVLDFKFKD